MRRNPRRQRGCERAAGLRSHVHESGHRTGKRSAHVGAHRPEGTLRQVQSPGASGKHHAGESCIIHFGAERKEDGCERHRKRGHTTSANTSPGAPGQHIAEDASEWARNCHRKKGKCSVERANLQIQPTHFAQIPVKPGEENPGNVAVTKITPSNQPNIPTGENSAPRRSCTGSSICW